MNNIFNSWLTKIPIAHRGLHDSISPENTLSAYEKAIRKGYTIEIDVRPLNCGTIVSFHDDTLDRLTNLTGEIAKYTYDEIKDVKILNTNQTIPTFKQVLEFVNGKVPLLIEIKNNGKIGFEEEVWKILKDYKGEYVIQSFNPLTLAWFEKHAPDVIRGQLSSFFENDNINFIKKFICKRMLLNKKCSKPHFISYNSKNLPNKYVNKYLGKIPVLAWVVRNKDEEEKLKHLCDNIIFEDYLP